MGKKRYLYPLTDSVPPDTNAFEAPAFHQNVTAAVLQEILTAAGVCRLWELREYGPEYEIDTALLAPYYNGAEGYWTTDGLDWLIYASHESTLTIAGARLLHAIQQQWPTWDQDPHQLVAVQDKGRRSSDLRPLSPGSGGGI